MIGKQIVFLAAWLVAAPFLAGMLYTKYSKRDSDSFVDSLLLSYCSGLIIMLAVSQLIAVPCVLLGGSLTRMTRLFMAVMAALCLVSLVVNRSVWRELLHSRKGKRTKLPWTVWAAVILILVQSLVLSVGSHIDDDDAFYVGMAVEAASTDRMYSQNPYTGEAYTELPARYILSPFPMFVAASSRVTGVHPTVLAHTVLPLLLIPFAYMIYGLLGRQLFGKDDRTAGYFLILTALLHLFSGYSVYTQGTFLLVRIWQGKALLAAALLPAVYYYCFRASRQGKAADYAMVLALMLACAHASSMGIMLGPVALGVAAIGCAVYSRRVKILILGFLCCIPNLIYAAMYLVIR